MTLSKALLASISLVILGTCLSGCGSSENAPTASIDTEPLHQSGEEHALPQSADGELLAIPSVQNAFEEETPVASPVEQFPEVNIVTSLGAIRVRLNGEKAPETVDNFLYNYVDRRFYDGTIFHFVQDEFIAIAGGYDAELQPKQARPPIRNEAGNGLKNKRGTIAMSRHAEYADSAASQFYFNLVDNPELDQTDPENGATFGYCVFGEVVEGLDVLDKIAQVEVDDAGEFPQVPVEPIVIQSISRVK